MAIITWSPSDKSQGVTLSNGNLTASITTQDSYVRASEFKKKGKWYWEIKITTIPDYSRVGVSYNLTHSSINNSTLYYKDGRIVIGTTTILTASPISVGDIVGIAVDVEANETSYYLNGILQGKVSSIFNSNIGFTPFIESGYANFSSTVNFGATPFAHPIPDEYKPYFYLTSNKILLLQNEKINTLQSSIGGKKLAIGTGVTLTNNDKTASITGINTTIVGEKPISEGKWYWEVKVDSGTFQSIAITKDGVNYASRQDNTGNSRIYYYAGSKYDTVSTSYGESYTVGDIIGIALDMDLGKIEFYKNGVSQGLAFDNLKSLVSVRPSALRGSSSGSATYTFAFEKNELTYPIPTGYKAYGDNILTVTDIPNISERNFIKYGMESPVKVDDVSIYKNYILQDTISENAEGHWTKKINRKPLSIKFN